MKRKKYRVLAVGDIRRGFSERTHQDWQAQDVVLEEVTDETPYPESFTASLPSDMVGCLRKDSLVECSAFIRARLWDDRYYNEVRVRNIMPAQDEHPFNFRPHGCEA
jgi:hypothetical protein